MFCQAGFDQWRTTIMQHLSPLSKPQATVLALWIFGMVLARSCALSAVSHLVATGGGGTAVVGARVAPGVGGVVGRAAAPGARDAGPLCPLKAAPRAVAPAFGSRDTQRAASRERR